MFSQAKQSCEELTEQQKIERDVAVMNSVEGKLTDYNCPKCKNKGVLYIAKNSEFLGNNSWEMVSRNCECLKIRDEIRRINQSGLSNLIKTKTFKSYKCCEDWQNHISITARHYANNPEGWFYIGGQSGCGKTHICTAIVGELLKKGQAVKYMVWQDDITTIRQVVNSDQTAFEALMKQFKEADVLYIDDFFKTKSGEKLSKSDVNLTFMIINYRYNKNLPTIISSDISVHAVADIDEPLGSRIIEKCGKRVIYISPDKFKNYRLRFGGVANDS